MASNSKVTHATIVRHGDLLKRNSIEVSAVDATVTQSALVIVINKDLWMPATAFSKNK